MISFIICSLVVTGNYCTVGYGYGYSTCDTDPIYNFVLDLAQKDVI